MAWTDTEWGDILLDAMQTENEGTAKGYSGGGSRNRASIYCPSYQAIAEQCSPSSPNPYGVGSGSLPSRFSTLTPWFWAWEGDGNTSTNTRIICGAMHAEIKRGDTGWVTLFTDKQLRGFVNAAVYADTSDPGDQIQLPDGRYTSIRPTQAKPLELWSIPFYAASDRASCLQMVAFHARCWAWLEGPDAANAHYIATLGYDLFEYGSSLPGDRRPPTGWPDRAQDGGHSKYFSLSTTPRLLTVTTVGPTTVAPGGRPPWVGNYGDGPAWIWGAGSYLLSEAGLRAALPSKPSDTPPSGSVPAPAPSPSPSPTPTPTPAPAPIKGPNGTAGLLNWKTRGGADEVTLVWSPLDGTTVVVPPDDDSVVTGVSISPDGGTVAVGDTLNLSATVSGVGGHSTAAIWTVSGIGAKVSQSGVVTGTKKGQVIVRAASAQNPSIFDEVVVTITAAVPTTPPKPGGWSRHIRGE